MANALHSSFNVPITEERDQFAWINFAQAFPHQLFLVLDSSKDQAGGWQQISITATDTNQTHLE